MEHFIENESLKVVIDTLGAEIKSVKSKKGTTFVGNGNSKAWTGTSPILFPICGALKDDKYIYNDKEYHLEKHGFARNMEFAAQKINSEEIIFSLTETSETLKKYPFKFELNIRYILKDNSLTIKYEIKNKNKNNSDMYVSIGAHEAYECKNGIEEYTVYFEKEETLNSYQVAGPIVSDEVENISQNSKELNLKYDYFSKDALIFKNLNSEKLVLSNGKVKIDVEFKGFDYLLFWTIKDEPFICIEPWCGFPDNIHSDYDITKKEGIITLSPKQTVTKTHTLTFWE